MKRRKAGEEGGAGVETCMETTNQSRVSSDLDTQEGAKEVLLEEPENSEEKHNSLSLESSYFLFFYSTSSSFTPPFEVQVDVRIYILRQARSKPPSSLI